MREPSLDQVKQRNKALLRRNQALRSYAEWALWNIRRITELAAVDRGRAITAMRRFEKQMEREFKRSALGAPDPQIADKWRSPYLDEQR